MIAMPIAGTLADRTGSGRIVPFGLLPVIASVLWLTQIGAHTSYVAISIDMFVFGIGMGFTMMPVFTGAIQSLRDAAVARATTALNILQQTGASIGTAVLSVLLASALIDQLGHHRGTLEYAARASHAIRLRIAPHQAIAFGHTFWWALGLLVVAFFGSLLLPKSKPTAQAGEGAPIVAGL